MMILQTTTDSDSVKDIDTKAAEIDFQPPLSFRTTPPCHSERSEESETERLFVILSEAKNLKREPGGSRIVVVLQILR